MNFTRSMTLIVAIWISLSGLVMLPCPTTSGGNNLDHFDNETYGTDLNFTGPGSNDTLVATIPAYSTVQSFSLNVEGRRNEENGSIFHTSNEDFNEAEEKGNVTIENGDVSPKRMAVLWEQSTDSEFNKNTLDGVTVNNGVRLWAPPVPSPVDTATVGLWDFDEGSGTVARDASPNGNDGAISGGPSWKIGMFGPSLTFNGTDNIVLVPASPDFVFQQLTVEAWIKSDLLTGTIISQEEGSSISWSLSVDGGHLTAKLMTTGTYSITGFKTISDSKWHHVALVYDGTYMSLYVDGLRETFLTISGAVVDYNLPIRMGCTFNGVNTSFWDGLLDNVRISNIARTSFNVTPARDGYMISPLIQNLGAFTGELRVNITTSVYTSYSVAIVNETNVTIRSGLHNGNTFNVDPAQSPVIRLWLTLSSASGDFGYSGYFRRATPVLHSWGFATGVMDYFQENERWPDDNQLEISDGNLKLPSSPTDIAIPAQNPVLSGSAGKWDSNGLNGSTVLKDGGTYKMWYDGSDGISTQIGYATSTDGVTWGKSETPVLTKGATGNWDNTSVMHPSVMKEDGIYKMWYEGTNGTSSAIGYAESSDGIQWTKRTLPVLMPGETGSWDAKISSPSVLKDRGMYNMFYTGVEGAVQKIGLASSNDGTFWEKDGACLEPAGGTLVWDAQGAHSPVVITDGNVVRMWYTGVSGGTQRIGYAEATSVHSGWVKSTKNPAISNGSVGSWYETQASLPAVLKEDGQFRFWFVGKASGGGTSAIGQAYSRFASSGTITSDPIMASNIPLAMTNFTISKSIPAGTTLTVTFRTSEDSVTWTGWEEVKTTGDPIQSALGQYVQFQVYMLTGDMRVSPTLYTLGYGYIVGPEPCRLISRAYNTTYPVSGYEVKITATSDPGLVRLWLTNDNGTTWLDTSSNGLNGYFPNRGTDLRYLVEFSNSRSKPMVLHDILINYTMGIYTKNITLDVDGDAVPEWTFDDFMLESNYSFISDPSIVDALNSYVMNASATAPEGSDVTIHFNFSSESKGRIFVSSLNIGYQTPLEALDWGPLGANTLGSATHIWVSTERSVDPASIDGTINVTTDKGVRVPGTAIINASNNLLEWWPSNPFIAPMKYTVVVSKSIADYEGIGMVKDLKWNFTVSNQSGGSTITHASPVGDVYEMPSNISMTFSNSVMTDTFAGAFSIKDPYGSIIGTSMEFDASNTSVYLIPMTQLSRDITYKINLNLEQTKDIDGWPLYPATEMWSDPFYSDGLTWGWFFTVKSGPAPERDLFIKDIRLGSVDFRKGENVRVIVTVGISGQFNPTELFKVRVELNGEERVSDVEVGLNPEREVEFETIVNDNRLSVNAWVDPFNLITETNESNNIKEAIFDANVDGEGDGGNPFMLKENCVPFIILGVIIIVGIVAGLAYRATRANKDEAAKELQESMAGTAAQQTRPQHEMYAQNYRPPRPPPQRRAPPPPVPVAPIRAAATAAAATDESGAIEDFDVDAVMLIYHDGRLMVSDLRKEAEMDSEIMSSMLVAVRDFVKDGFKAEEGLESFEFSGRKVLMTRGQHSFLTVALSGKEPPGLQDEMQRVMERFEGQYAGVLAGWDGMKDGFANATVLFGPIFAFKEKFEIMDIVAVKSGLEFYGGYVRLKVGIMNKCGYTISDVKFSLDFNREALRLVKIEPYMPTDGSTVEFGSIQRGKKKTVAYYLDPLICQESDIDGTVTYRDHLGKRHHVDMKTRPVDVVCPLFYTKETINIAMLKRLVGELRNKDSKWFEVGDPAMLRKVFDETCAEVGAHDVKLVRTYAEGERDPAGYVSEAWFYGETRTGDGRPDGIVIMVRAQASGNTLQIMVACNNLAAQTGLLAELGNKAVQRLGGTLEPVFEQLKDQDVAKVTYLLDKYGESEMEVEDE